MFDPGQLLRYVIEPALKAVDLYSQAAAQLLVGTCAAESQLGRYLHQVNGPALGIFQMEPATHSDIWDNFLSYRDELRHVVMAMCPDDMWSGDMPKHDLLVTDLRYAAVMARLKYRRSPKQLAGLDDWPGHARLWKTVYNSTLGAGTELKFMDAIVSCKVIA